MQHTIITKDRVYRINAKSQSAAVKAATDAGMTVVAAHTDPEETALSEAWKNARH